MKYCMRMLATHRRQLRDLLSERSREQACFLICSVARGENKTILLVREVLPLQENDLLVQAHDQLSVMPAAMLRVAKHAAKTGGSICMVHTHPAAEGDVQFSRADDWGNFRTFEFFQRLVPEGMHSCLVFDGLLSTVAGRVYGSPSDWTDIECIDVVSGSRREQLAMNQYKACDEQYDRQAKLLGREGQQYLSELSAGIIGCGGVGSVAATLLGHSGIRAGLLVDPDALEISNLPRILGSTPADAARKKPKVEIVHRALIEHAPNSTWEMSMLPVEDPSLKKRLIDLDFLVCGTDDTTSRAFVNNFSHQYYVPVLDLGVQFCTDPSTGRLIKETGRAHLMLPGTACMVCTGQINPQKLAEEGLTSEQKEQQQQDGYIVGATVSEPSMMVFNMQVVSAGIQRLVQWVTGVGLFHESEFDVFRFFGLAGHSGMKSVKKNPESRCIFCGDSPILRGVGDESEMLVRQRVH